MTPERYCEQKAAPPGSDLYYSFLYLNPEIRPAVMAIHALREELRGLVELGREPQIAHAKLDWWREELDRCFTGNPQHPVTRALQAPLERHNLPREYFLEMLDGTAWDVNGQRYQTLNELSLHCYRVSGVLALMTAELCGYRHRETLAAATGLGTAFRLTEILQNLGEDLRNGHLYLPLEDLNANRLAPEDLVVQAGSDRLRSLARGQIERARQQFDLALRRMPAADRPAQLPLLIRAAIDRTLLDEMEADGPRLTGHRLNLTPLRKFWIAWSTQRREKRHALR